MENNIGLAIMSFGMLDIVKLKEPSSYGITEDDQGVIVGLWTPGVWEVEFCHSDGTTKTMFEEQMATYNTKFSPQDLTFYNFRVILM